MRYSCAWPRIAYVDKVIVESEAMRSFYINEYIKSMEGKEITVDETELNNKIVILGTPKDDKMAVEDSENILLPDEWQNKIFNLAGKRKKAVLYQISINSFLTEGMELLDKLENVLAYFNERKEVVLWWRTPTLLKGMPKKMRPELWSRYMEIAERYRREGWGIYDDTDNQVRAISATDGYFGDWNSIIWEYENRGKPVLLQNKEVFKENDKKEWRILTFEDMLKEDNEIWLSNITFNGLFKIQLYGHRVEFVGRFEEEVGSRRLHRYIIRHQKWLIFIPDKAGKIAFFDKQTYKLEYVDIVLPENSNGKEQISGAYIYRNRLFVFSSFLKQAIIEIDLKSREVSYNNALRKKVGTSKDLNVNEPFFGQAVMQEGMVWLPINNTAKIAGYRLEDGKVEIYRLKDEKYGIWSIDAAGDRFWLTSAETSEIREWSPSTGELDKYTIDIQWEKGKNPFAKVISISEAECLILPAYAEDIIHKTGNAFKKLEYPDGFGRLRDFRKNLPLFGECRREGDKLFLCPMAGNMLLIYDIRKGTMEGKMCTVPADWDTERIIGEHVHPYYMREYVEGHKAAYEEQREDLDSFLYWVMNHKRLKREDNIGEKIYRFLTENE